ncbi:MAG: hypothetical protein AUG55_00180 [Candidatus Rokubacteria bacterium 13_1_20CM_4_70_13]|nr:MAG: hypothetical protein AUG55_00180 [Candidatus Rokubacteria bacterium 13_1_20CM_4_70_13]
MTAVVVALFGGLALLLYGIRLSGDSLQRAAGGRLRSLLTGMARHRPIAVASGAAVTAIIQSSAATTLMLIGFVSAGLMTFRQTLGIILGADIGTTFTVQLIAFKVTDYALLLVGLGFTITFLAGRRALKDVGQAILGLGLVFLGLKVILEGVAPLRDNRLAMELIEAVAGNTTMAILVAAVFSALVASSAATLGVALALASQGLIGLNGAVAIVLGANIGTCATALTASMGATAEAKRVAVAHIAFKLLGAAGRARDRGDRARRSDGRHAVPHALPRRARAGPALARARPGHARGAAHGRRGADHAARHRGRLSHR